LLPIIATTSVNSIIWPLRLRSYIRAGKNKEFDVRIFLFHIRIYSNIHFYNFCSNISLWRIRIRNCLRRILYYFNILGIIND
jgi:hypothetical protein